MGQTFQNRGWQDREVKIRRTELLAVLKENRSRHIKDFKVACEGYREAALKRIDKIFGEVRDQVARLKKGETVAVIGLHFNLAVPVSHERAYNQTIKMMEMEVEDNVVLTASQFACFVMDDWDWTQEFRNSTSPYFGGVAASWQAEDDQ